jgi:hypothetical protein
MTKAEISAREEKPTAEEEAEKETRQTSLEELARAQRRIAALERKIGQQQVELDFFSKPRGKSALTMAITARQPKRGALIDHSDRGANMPALNTRKSWRRMTSGPA